jgi:RNA-directed DNA polymerase
MRVRLSGVDGQTWEHYGETLEANLQDLSQRLKRGAYRARPVRRVYIPKVGKPGELRPLGVPALEDKIVQRAISKIIDGTVECLNASTWAKGTPQISVVAPRP